MLNIVQSASVNDLRVMDNGEIEQFRLPDPEHREQDLVSVVQKIIRSLPLTLMRSR